MVVVFLAFVASPDVFLKLFGIGLASAIFLDATLVRMVLVPAVMQLLGSRNWWIPDWLERILPRLDVERVAAAGAESGSGVRGSLERSAQAPPERDAGPLQVAVDGGNGHSKMLRGLRAESPNTSLSTNASCCLRGSSPTAPITRSIDWRRPSWSIGSTRSVASSPPPRSSRRLIWSSDALVAIR